MSSLSLKDRLKQYHNLKENSVVAQQHQQQIRDSPKIFKPSSTKEELEELHNSGSLRTSLRKLQGAGIDINEDRPPSRNTSLTKSPPPRPRSARDVEETTTEKPNSGSSLYEEEIVEEEIVEEVEEMEEEIIIEEDEEMEEEIIEESENIEESEHVAHSMKSLGDIATTSDDGAAFAPESMRSLEPSTKPVAAHASPSKIPQDPPSRTASTHPLSDATEASSTGEKSEGINTRKLEAEELYTIPKKNDWMPPMPKPIDTSDIVDERSVDEFDDEIHPFNTAPSFTEQEAAPEDEMAEMLLKDAQGHSSDDDVPVSGFVNEPQEGDEEEITFSSVTSAAGEQSAPGGASRGDVEQALPDPTAQKPSSTRSQSAKPSSARSQSAKPSSARSSSQEDLTGFSPKSAGPPRDDEVNRRYNRLLALLICVGAIAIVAIILPFFYDYNRDDRDTSALNPTFAPILTPTSTPGDSVPTAVPDTPDGDAPSEGTEPTDTTPSSTPPPPTSTPADSPTVPPFAQMTLERLIEEVGAPISGEEVFEDEESPQSNAAAFIANDDEFARTLSTRKRLEERYAALVLYFALDGDNWIQCSRTDTDCENRWLEGDHCDWFGMMCNGDEHVSSLFFGEPELTGMQGELPMEVSVFDEVESMVFLSETISGSLPEKLGELTTLTQLVLQDLLMEGTIPENYLSGSPLALFYMGGNVLTGTVPNSIGNPVTLRQLDLGGNFLTGPIPDFSAYTELESLALNANGLTGEIPASLYEVTSLEELVLDMNPVLTGTLSKDVGNLVSLQELLLADTSLSGTVPASLGNLKALEILALHENDFVGSISPDICAIKKLDELTVDCEEVTCDCCTQCFRR